MRAKERQLPRQRLAGTSFVTDFQTPAGSVILTPFTPSRARGAMFCPEAPYQEGSAKRFTWGGEK